MLQLLFLVFQQYMCLYVVLFLSDPLLQGHVISVKVEFVSEIHDTVMNAF